MKIRLFAVLGLFLLFISVNLAHGESFPKGFKENPLVVDVSIFPPMVMQNKDGHLYGMDIDLMNAIAQELKLEIEYRVVDFGDVFSDLEKGIADVAISGITMTAERNERIDFSYHYLDSGLRIMVLDVKNVDGEYDVDIMQIMLNIVKSRQNQKILKYYLLFVLISGLVIFWNENFDKEHGWMNKTNRAVDTLYSVIVSGTTATFIHSEKWLSKVLRSAGLFAGMVILSGVIIGQIVGQVSSNLTVQKLQTSIANQKHLAGKVVATKKDTTSVQSLKKYGASVIAVEDISEAYEMLLKKQVDAVVFDAPDLLYYAKGAGEGKVALVGELFDRQYYAIAFPKNFKLREEVNRTLLKFRENGVVGKIYRRWLADLEK